MALIRKSDLLDFSIYMNVNGLTAGKQLLMKNCQHSIAILKTSHYTEKEGFCFDLMPHFLCQSWWRQSGCAIWNSCSISIVFPVIYCSVHHKWKSKALRHKLEASEQKLAKNIAGICFPPDINSTLRDKPL